MVHVSRRRCVSLRLIIDVIDFKSSVVILGVVHSVDHLLTGFFLLFLGRSADVI